MLFVVAGFLTACNNDASSSSDVKDSLKENLDSIKDAKVDSLSDSIDREKDKLDTSFHKTDSANKAIDDSMKKANH